MTFVGETERAAVAVMGLTVMFKTVAILAVTGRAAVAVQGLTVVF